MVNGDAGGRGPALAGLPGDEGERISQGLADGLMHRLFAVGLDLHAALTYIEADISTHVTVDKLHKAIHGLDGAIRDFRGVVFGLYPEGAAERPNGLRTLIVEAVERACDPGEACPSITLGHGMEAVIDPPAWQRAAELVHRTLTLVPGEYLSAAHVAITADPRPPIRLVIHIDAPAGNLAEFTGRLRALNGCGVDLSCQALPRSPERSRIRLEWPMTPR
ncbi:MAG: Histidine kinase [Actinoallomurus sp.]|nr:Histidine kinase [Actinoallomurus sp.]